MAKLTVLITCRDEEKNLPDCLASVAWADEVYVVDSGSTDASVELARAAGARVEQHPYINPAAQKNWAIPRATHPWVLVVDADERVTPALAEEIRAVIADERDADAADLYRIGRDNWAFGQRIRRCGWANDRVWRLGRRDRFVYGERHVHESPELEGRRLADLKGRFEHYTYRSWDQYLEKFGRYTTWGALEARKRGRRCTAWNIIAKPSWKFFNMYFLRLGALDGMAGLMLCLSGAFYVFMRQAKLWAINRVDAGDANVEIGRTEW